MAHVLVLHTYQGIQKKNWLGLQINISGLLVIILCYRMWEETCTAHTPNFAHLDIHKPQAMVYRLETFKDDKGIAVLQSLKISHVSIIPN